MSRATSIIYTTRNLRVHANYPSLIGAFKTINRLQCIWEAELIVFSTKNATNFQLLVFKRPYIMWAICITVMCLPFIRAHDIAKVLITTTAWLSQSALSTTIVSTGGSNNVALSPIHVHTHSYMCVERMRAASVPLPATPSIKGQQHQSNFNLSCITHKVGNSMLRYCLQ